MSSLPTERSQLRSCAGWTWSGASFQIRNAELRSANTYGSASERIAFTSSAEALFFNPKIHFVFFVFPKPRCNRFLNRECAVWRLLEPSFETVGVEFKRNLFVAAAVEEAFDI